MSRVLDWLQLPEVASLHGATVDAMNEFLHLFMLVLFVGWTAFFLFCIWRFWHKRNPKADYVGVRGHASTHLEVSVVIIEAILLIGFAWPFWFQRVEAWPTGDDVVEVRAVAYQFGWAFHYPGQDGKFGRIDYGLYTENPVGLDKEDPNAADDFITVGNMTLPVDQPIIVHVSSRDVIHNLSMVPLRVSQDAMPNEDYPVWFTPTKIGEWEIICGQLCGAGHGSMRALYNVVSTGDYAKFLLENAPAPPVAAASQG